MRKTGPATEQQGEPDNIGLDVRNVAESDAVDQADQDIGGQEVVVVLALGDHPVVATLTTSNHCNVVNSKHVGRPAGSRRNRFGDGRRRGCVRPRAGPARITQ